MALPEQHNSSTSACYCTKAVQVIQQEEIHHTLEPSHNSSIIQHPDAPNRLQVHGIANSWKEKPTFQSRKHSAPHTLRPTSAGMPVA